MKIAFHPIYKHPLPEGHRFPMLKYELLPKQLLHEGTAEKSDFFEPEICDIKHILAVHEKHNELIIRCKISQKNWLSIIK
jgi:acetoin utilization deacetylase AcuC-like enzyme